MTTDIIFFPFVLLLVLLFAAIAVLALIFWIWMIIDCAKRDFKNETEKIVWILVIVLAGLIGAIIYYFVIKASKTKGVAKK
jgi:prolipoprotein diacylglyceryltransferase